MFCTLAFERPAEVAPSGTKRLVHNCPVAIVLARTNTVAATRTMQQGRNIGEKKMGKEATASFETACVS